MRHSDSVRLSLPAKGGLQIYLSYDDPGSDRAVVYVHGFGSTRAGVKADAVEQACARRGWTFASFDFRGHGQSTGTLLELRGSALLEDLEALRDHLVARGIRRLFLVGSSMGGWAAAWFALHHAQSVLACVLIAPAFDFLHGRLALLSEQERARWKQTGRLRVQNQYLDVELGYGLVEEIDRFPLDRLATGLARPLLILHGMKDDVVSYLGSVNFVERAAWPDLELRLYKNGDHRLLAYSEEMAETACSFFARHAP
jgi:uncharacterized protein